MGGQARTYDAAGNTTQMKGLTYAYNNAGRLGQFKQGATVLGIYRYNHRGERVLRQAGGKNTTTLYDQSGQWLGEYSASGAPMQQVVWLENYPIAVFSESSAGVPALGYVQPDHLGTPRVIIDAARNVLVWDWNLAGEAFGADAANEDPDGDGVAFGFALRFPGQQATPESGLNYNYQRDYDAGVGRYVQSDPIGLAGGINSYLYARAAPTTTTDRQGLCPACLLVPLIAPEAGAAALSTLAWAASAIGAGRVGSELIDQFSKDGSESKPDDCPAGTLPIDKVKSKLGLDHDQLEGIKRGAGAGPKTWTGIDPEGNVWVGTPDGSGENAGPYTDYYHKGVR